MPQNPLATPGPWDDIADDYDEVTVRTLRPFAARALELADPAPSARVIDIAAGPGTLALLAAPKVREVVAVDFAESMIRRLRHTVMHTGATNVLTGVGDGQDLHYPSDRFDAAFSMFGVIFFPDKAQGFAEILRVLRPGGVAVVSSWAPTAQSPLMTLLSETYRAGIPGYVPRKPDPNGLENPDVLEKELAAAGFTDITVEPFSGSYTFDSVEQLWDAASRGSAPMRLLRARVDEDTWKAQEQAMIEYLTANFTPGTALSSTALLARAHKPL